MERTEPSFGEPVLNHACAESQLQQLAPGQDAVLNRRQVAGTTIESIASRPVPIATSLT